MTNFQRHPNHGYALAAEISLWPFTQVVSQSPHLVSQWFPLPHLTSAWISYLTTWEPSPCFSVIPPLRHECTLDGFDCEGICLCVCNLFFPMHECLHRDSWGFIFISFYGSSCGFHTPQFQVFGNVDELRGKRNFLSGLSLWTLPAFFLANELVNSLQTVFRKQLLRKCPCVRPRKFNKSASENDSMQKCDMHGPLQSDMQNNNFPVSCNFPQVYATWRALDSFWLLKRIITIFPSFYCCKIPQGNNMSTLDFSCYQ